MQNSKSLAHKCPIFTVALTKTCKCSENRPFAEAPDSVHLLSTQARQASSVFQRADGGKNRPRAVARAGVEPSARTSWERNGARGQEAHAHDVASPASTSPAPLPPTNSVRFRSARQLPLPRGQPQWVGGWVAGPLRRGSSCSRAPLPTRHCHGVSVPALTARLSLALAPC
jgi:hypothetical protein